MKEEILKTSILHLLNSLLANERVHLHEDMLENIEDDAASIPAARSELDEYRKWIERAALVFRHSPKSPETQHIAKLDSRRGTLWRGGKRFIKIALENASADIRAAAADLSILVNNTYGDVPRFSLYGETGTLNHAIADFRATGNQMKVALINGLPGLIDELESVNSELELYYHIRLEEAEAVRQLGKLTRNLRQTDKQLVALFHVLNMVYGYNERMDKNPEVKATIERIATHADALLAQLRTVLSRHSK